MDRAVAQQQGVNDDGKVEYYVQSMPSDLVLLCAHEYASDGAAVFASLTFRVWICNLCAESHKSVVKTSKV